MNLSERRKQAVRSVIYNRIQMARTMLRLSSDKDFHLAQEADKIYDEVVNVLTCDKMDLK